MRVQVDKGVCIGSGKCNLIAEDVFSQDDDGVVILLNDSPGEDRRDDVAEAVSECPADAISIPE